MWHVHLHAIWGVTVGCDRNNLVSIQWLCLSSIKRPITKGQREGLRRSICIGNGSISSRRTVGRGTQERQRLCSLNRCDRNFPSLCLDNNRACHLRTPAHKGCRVEANRLSWSYTSILQCLGRVTIAPGIEIGSGRVIIIADATVVEGQLVRVAIPIIPIAVVPVPIAVSIPVVPLRVGAGEIN